MKQVLKAKHGNNKARAIMQTIKETEGNITDNKIIIETVELPDELIRLAEDLQIDIPKIVADRVKALQGIFP